MSPLVQPCLLWLPRQPAARQGSTGSTLLMTLLIFLDKPLAFQFTDWVLRGGRSGDVCQQPSQWGRHLHRAPDPESLVDNYGRSGDCGVNFNCLILSQDRCEFLSVRVLVSRGKGGEAIT